MKDHKKQYNVLDKNSFYEDLINQAKEELEEEK